MPDPPPKPPVSPEVWQNCRKLPAPSRGRDIEASLVLDSKSVTVGGSVTGRVTVLNHSSHNYHLNYYSADSGGPTLWAGAVDLAKGISVGRDDGGALTGQGLTLQPGQKVTVHVDNPLYGCVPSNSDSLTPLRPGTYQLVAVVRTGDRTGSGGDAMADYLSEPVSVTVIPK